MKRGLSDENGDASELEFVETVSMLQSECRRRGLSVAGPEVLLRERLRAHSAGQAALMKKPRHLSLDGLAREGVEHISLSIGHHSGAETFLALPHDVIKRVLLPHVQCGDLFSLAMTCKYLHNDCIGEAESRSKFIFRGDSRATAMTLHLLCKLVDMTRRVTVLTGRALWEKGIAIPAFHAWSINERAKRASAILGLDDPDSIVVSHPRDVREGIHYRLSKFGLDVHGDVIEYDAAAWTLRAFRDTEQAKAALVFSRAQEDAKKAEAALVARYKQDRVSELNRALFGSKTEREIAVFAYDAQTDEMVVTAIGSVVFKMFGVHDKKKCRTFILKATPSLPTAVKHLTNHNDFYDEYKRHARKGRVIDLALAAAQAHATIDNASRLAVWLRAFFCMDTHCKGALFDCLLELTPEYIDALVMWIVATPSLPVTVQEICPPTYTKMHAVFLRVNNAVGDLPPAVHYEIDLAKPHPTILAESVTPVGHVSSGVWETNKLFPLGAALKRHLFSSVSWFGMSSMWIEIEKGIPPLIAIINE